MELIFRNKNLSLDQAIVMGIVNCTPDSFFDESRQTTENEILNLVEKHLNEGAQIIDLGAYSTRPNIALIDVNEEINRIKKPIEWIKKTFPNAILSIDTFRSEVAKFSLENGADLINDISGGKFDPEILNVVSKFECPYIAMHLEGSVETMHQTKTYEPSISSYIKNYFETKISEYKSKGIHQIVLDPGFGFSKTMDDNFNLLKNLEELSVFELPILVGISRKRMIWKTLKSSPSEALNGTTTLNTIALHNGAKILRVHDVKQAVEAITLFQKLS